MKRNHRRTDPMCPWVSRAAGPSAGHEAPPSDPGSASRWHVTCPPVFFPERLPADCQWPERTDCADWGRR